MSEPDQNQQQKPTQETRLIFQGSIPLENSIEAEKWYAMLKEMVKSQSPRATLSGQIIKMLEPCCNEKHKTQLLERVQSIGP